MNRAKFKFVLIISIIAAATLALSFEAALRYGGKLAVRGAQTGGSAASNAARRAEADVPFALNHAVLKTVDFDKRVAELLLVFSRPVLTASVRERLVIELAGKPVSGVQLSDADREEEVLVTFKVTAIDNMRDLKIKVGKGVRSRKGDAVTDLPFEKTFALVAPKRLNINSTSLQEGASGFYLEVYCADDANEDNRYQCDVPVENIKDSVRITPSVSPTFIPEMGGFRIFGDFRKGEYQLVIEAGLMSNKGGVLTETYQETITVGQRTPKARFIVKGRYLPRQRLVAVPIRHINVNKVKVIVRQIPEQNIVFWFSGDEETADDRSSDIVAVRELEVPNKEDTEITSWINLSGMAPKGSKGVFEFNLQAGESSDAVRLILTELNLVVKRSGQDGRNLLVWALDSNKLTPVKGASIELMSVSNRLLARGVTDSNGLAQFDNVADSILEAKRAPFAIIARTADDLTAMRLSDLEIDLSEYQVQGAPYHADQPYRAAIYMDRGVYRPGETAHLVSIVWEDSNRAPKDAVPVIGRVKDPKGNEVERLSAKTNPAGMVNFDLSFQDFAATGKYLFSLEIANKEIERQTFLVEEFVPERMKAKLTPLKEAVLMKEPSEFRLEAKYLFGAVARGERTETSCTLEQGDFRLDQYPGYSFGVWRAEPFRPVPLGVNEGALDEKGEGAVKCEAVNKITSFKGPGLLNVMASVFEGGSGRTSVARASIPVHPDKYYLGLRSATTEAKVGQTVNVDGVVVDWKGNLVKEVTSVKITIIELQSEWVWENDPDLDRSTWRRYLRELPSSTNTVTVRDGRFKYSFAPAEYAYGYVVRASAGSNIQADLYLKGEGYVWWEEGYGEEGGETPKPSAPEGIRIEAPELAQVGKPVKVTITLPYPGRLLFSVESDQVLEYRWVDVQAGPYTTEFTLKEFTPNVYISALLIKNPYYESKEAFIPGRAFGIKSVKVDPEGNKLALKVTAPAEVQPDQELTVQLESDAQKGPLFATVAAVDEGILQLTNFQTPDPLATMFKKRALGVGTFETIGWTLLLPPLSGTGSPGGDHAGEEGAGWSGGRVQAIKPVALWSGVVQIGPDGKAEVKFKVPTYRGKLRVMAVAAGAAHIGFAEASVLVRDPLVIQPTFPRFLMTDDEFVVPVFVANLTGRKETVEVELKASMEVAIKGDSKKTIVLAPDQAETVTFLCRTVAAFGTAVFDVEARGGKVVSKDHAQIPLLPNGPLTIETSVQKLTQGVNDLTGSLKGWAPQYEQTTVSVINNRYAKELGHLKYLIRYPYGCIEQTTSTTRPLLYIGNIVSSIDPAILKDGTIETKFMYGIRRLFSMQTSGGGFSYWPGEQEPTYWGTAYVTHLMLEGIEAGYPISKDRVNRAIQFMEDILTHTPDKKDPKYGYSMAESEPYMQFVLARAGKARPGRIKSLIEHPKQDWGELKEENLFLLKAALYLSGDRTYEKDLKNPPLDIRTDRTNGWTFWSALRTRGMMLEIMEDLFPNNPQNEALAQTIADRLKSQSWYYTTQELSWCVSALGKRSAGGARNWSMPSLSLDGKIIKPLPRPNEKDKQTTWQVSGASGAKRFLITIDSIEGGDLFALMQVEGLKPGAPYELGDHSLQVRRQYRKADGSNVDPKNIRLGDVIYVELTLTNLTGEDIQNVALVDRFGAGLEIENPRLDREHIAEWVDADTLWETSYVNMRDDHVEIFGNLPGGKAVTAVYVLRAATGGKFTTPPVRAEVMYEPRQFSQQLGEPIRILDLWNTLTD